MTDNVPCALCEERVYVDEPHCKLNVEYKGRGERPETYRAHIECVGELRRPEP